MKQATIIFNRQVLRLCKGVLKAWEQWVDDIEQEVLPSTPNPNLTKKLEEVKKYDGLINS